MELVQSADFWIGLVKIVWINIILSGDNAVVIALAARSLPPHQQRKAVFWGSGAAVVLRPNCCSCLSCRYWADACYCGSVFSCSVAMKKAKANRRPMAA
jgi:predicted tellurium resistance membrane protein TerC